MKTTGAKWWTTAGGGLTARRCTTPTKNVMISLDDEGERN
jgi:hypothetical protein